MKEKEKKVNALLSNATAENVQEITEENVLSEIACAIKDCFIATVNKDKNILTLRFFNGKTFQLTISAL